MILAWRACGPSLLDSPALNPRPSKTMEHQEREKLREEALTLFTKALQLSKKASFTDPDRATAGDAIGTLAAQYVRWNCEDAFEIAYNVLEECNMHNLCKDLSEAWKADQVKTFTNVWTGQPVQRPKTQAEHDAEANFKNYLNQIK